MQILKTLPVLLLLSAAYASPTLHKRRKSRKECIRAMTYLVRDATKEFKPNAVVCYHGRNSATDERSTLTDKHEGHFGNKGYYKCGNVGIDCFWMKGKNQWKGYEDAGDDNIHVLFTRKKCKYIKDAVSVICD
ncbi:uncharacterized protein SPSC_05472 [Sporisorium scitamineum]|uniref:DUF7888 domain-containing protein n=1 Tax=Sporisorium scitamineum TaxID=49012 RepID=A0A127ZHK6_9BASI|nr:uncharacterized protein SPSC_05472 [Sporisorium scitamineum]